MQSQETPECFGPSTQPSLGMHLQMPPTSYVLPSYLMSPGRLDMHSHQQHDLGFADMTWAISRRDTDLVFPSLLPAHEAAQGSNAPITGPFMSPPVSHRLFRPMRGLQDAFLDATYAHKVDVASV
jgi:hypothetical protein